MIVLDTNVISERTRPEPNPNVLAWVAAQPRATLFTTSINRAEILYGVAALPPGRRRASFQEVVTAIFSEDFADRVLPFGDTAAEHYARIVSLRRKAGTRSRASMRSSPRRPPHHASALQRATSEAFRVAASTSSILGRTRISETHLPSRTSICRPRLRLTELRKQLRPAQLQRKKQQQRLHVGQGAAAGHGQEFRQRDLMHRYRLALRG